MRWTDDKPVDLDSLTSLLRSEIDRQAREHSAELNKACLENFQVFVRESEIKLAIENLVGRATFRERD